MIKSPFVPPLEKGDIGGFEVSVKVLFIGDITGEAGREVLSNLLPKVVDRYKIDFTVANGENAAAGFGITPKIAEEFFRLGIHVITTGNHVWDKKEVLGYLSNEQRLLRPANYPEGVEGFGKVVLDIDIGYRVGVLHLMGRVFMTPIDCPFRCAKREIEELKRETNVIIVDFHAEATSEKIAMGWFLDGEVSAVIGTHTHVQTADERILPQGTAYITDVGMTGPIDSVIGINKESIIDKFLTQTPRRFETAKGPALLSYVIIDIDPDSGGARNIQRLQLKG